MNEAIFAATIERVLFFEGGYANNQSDPGGETNFGISKAAYPALDIRALTEAEAIDIYRRDYWVKTRIAELGDAASGATLDLSINLGPSAGVRLLQTALNDVDARLRVDGVIGDRTIAASQAAGGEYLVAHMRWRAAMHYLAIVDRRPSSKRFLEGWLRRACALV